MALGKAEDMRFNSASHKGLFTDPCEWFLLSRAGHIVQMGSRSGLVGVDLIPVAISLQGPSTA